MFIGFGSGANSSLHLYSNNIETITAKNSNVGIGNSDPSYILDISKRMRLRSETTSQGAGIWFNKNDNSIENVFLGNDVSNNLQVYSLAGNRTIATFNPTTGGFRVEGPTATASGNAIASFGGNGDFLVDKPGQVGGRLTIKENGAIGVGGSLGASGQVLTSNGSSASPTWMYPIAQSATASNTFGLVIITSASELLPSLTRAITIPTGQNARLLVSMNATYSGNGCTGLGCNPFGYIDVYLNGNILFSNISLDPNTDFNGTVSIANLSIDVGAGTHTIEFKGGKASTTNSFGIRPISSTVIALPQ